MIRASRLELLPAKPPVRTITPWLFVVFVFVATAVSWWFHITATAVAFTVLSGIIAVGFAASSIERRRQREAAAKLPQDASCTFARSFDFRDTDTFAMRAVFEELQPFVKIPMLASHRLLEDL